MSLVVAGGLVATGAGTAVAAAGAGPAVSSLSVTSGATAGHVKVTVHGSGFSHVSAVLFGGAKAGSVHVLSTHTLTLTVPKHLAGRVDVRVVTRLGTSPKSKHDVYAYVAPPVVKSVTPASGGKDGGVVVTVKGSNFTHVRKVMFSHTAGTAVHVKSSTSLTVKVPAHLLGVVDVRVVTAYGTSAAKVADRFSYVGPVINATLASAERGVAYTRALTATGGRAPYTWSVSGLPTGLAVSAAGTVSGTTFLPARDYPLTLSVVDAAGHTDSTTLSLTVRVHAGQVYAWGDNTAYELGDGTATGPVKTPALLAGMTGVVQAVGGSLDGFALRADGTVYGWGKNSYGELGLGDTNARPTPVQIPGLSGIVSLAAGQYTTYAVKSDGTLMAWGHNAFGAVGDGTTVDRSVPTSVLGVSGVVSVAAGSATAYALRSDGSVWSWGDNTFGELGAGTTVASSPTPAPIPGLTGVVQVSSKIYNGVALLADGTVKAWGYNPEGEVGDVTTTQRNSPTAVLGLSGVVKIANADYDTYVLMNDGTVRAWGRNDSNQLGDGSTINRLSPVTLPGLAHVVDLGAAAYTGYAITDTAFVYAWGSNPYGEVGNGTTTNQATPQLIPSLFGATELSATHLAQYAIR